jgi:hypothetical protein
MKILLLSLDFESFAIFIAPLSSSALIIGATGPKTSSCATSMASITLARIVGL